MAYKDLGNNIQFDPETGQIQIVDASGAAQYGYDPRSDQTLLGNQYYKGELNPQVLSAITPEEYQTAINKYQTIGDLGVDMTDPKIANAFGNNLGDYSNEQNALMNQFGSLATSKSTMDAYNTQLSQMQNLGDPFSKAIQNLAKQQGVMSAQETKNAGIQSTIDQGEQRISSYIAEHPGMDHDTAAIMSNPDVPDAVKQAQLGDKYPGSPAPPVPALPKYDTGAGQHFDYSVGHYISDTPVASAAPVAQVPQNPPAAIQDPEAGMNQKAPMELSTPNEASTQPAATPDYSGFLEAIYNQFSPYFSGQAAATPSTPDTTTNSSEFSSPSFNIGGVPSSKEPVLGTQSASPDFSLGGYNAQSNYQDTSTGSSGKAGTSGSTSQSSGMATGQFGSK